MAKKYPSEIQDRFIVRMPDGLRDRIAEAAKASNRSMNAEIVARLAAYENLQAENADLHGAVRAIEAHLDKREQELAKEREVSRGMQVLMAQASAEARREEEEKQQTLETISNRYNDLVEQRKLLDGLKEELQQLIEERGQPGYGKLLTEQAQLIEEQGRRLAESASLLDTFRQAFFDAADGDDDLLNRLKRQFNK